MSCTTNYICICKAVQFRASIGVLRDALRYAAAKPSSIIGNTSRQFCRWTLYVFLLPSAREVPHATTVWLRVLVYNRQSNSWAHVSTEDLKDWFGQEGMCAHMCSVWNLFSGWFMSWRAGDVTHQRCQPGLDLGSIHVVLFMRRFVHVELMRSNRSPHHSVT